MKKVLASVMTLLLLCTMLPLGAVSVGAAIVNGLMYEIVDGEVTITGCTDDAPADLVIPSTIEGYPVTAIGENAFYEQNIFFTITIPASVTTIGAGAFVWAGLSSFSVAQDNPAFSTIDGVLFDKNAETLVSYPHNKKGDYVVPDSVTAIGDYAFAGCGYLTGITIPEGVTTIGVWAFYECGPFSSIIIPDSVTSLGAGAFLRCYGLKVATLGSGITAIPERTFWEALNLQWLSVRGIVTSIGSQAFLLGGIYGGYEDNFENLYFAGTEEQWNAIRVADGNADTLNEVNIHFNCPSVEQIEVTKKCIEGDLFYSIIDGTAYVLGAAKYPVGDIVIPGTIEGCPVVINDNAFGGTLTSVVISEGVTAIGDYAFSDCSSLTSVTIPDSVTAIGVYAFSDCKSLVSVTIPDSVTSLGEGAFFDCDKLQFVTIGDGVTAIGDNTFEHCSKLTSVQLGGSITSIGDYAFSNCQALTSLVIPNGVCTIGEYAFTSCTGLNVVTLPDSLKTVGTSVFEYCYWLMEIYYGGDAASRDQILIGEYNERFFEATWHYDACVHVYDSNCDERCNVCGDERQTLHCYVNACDADCMECGTLRELNYLQEDTSTKVLISIADEYVDFVFVPEETGYYEFRSLGGQDSDGDPIYEDTYGYIYDANEKNLVYDDDNGEHGQFLMVQKMMAGTPYILRAEYNSRWNTGAFNVCVKKLEEGLRYTVSDGQATITEYIGDVPSDLTIPSEIDGYAVTAIGKEAFEGCDQLTTIHLPSSLTTIGNYAFAHCSALLSIVIPDGVTEIGYRAFDECSSLVSIVIPSGVSVIGSYTFYQCISLTSVTIPNTVTTIGDSAFAYCSSLTSVTIPDSVTTIEYSAFHSCNRLISVTIGDGVTTIGGSAFSYCTSLTSVTIPDSVTTIEYTAFARCNSLSSVTIGDGVLAIASTAFLDNTSLIAINVKEGNAHYASQDGVLFNKDKTELLTYPCGKEGAYIVPDSVINIGQYAFRQCSGLVSMTIPDSVTTIGSQAFLECSKLTELTIGNSVTSIGEDAFYGCDNLTDVYYAGSEEERAEITINVWGNDPLLNATWHYNYSPEPEITPGDGNGDGKVNNRDLGQLQRYINSWDVEILFAACDLNGDGKVNNRDLGLLQLQINT